MSTNRNRARLLIKLIRARLRETWGHEREEKRFAIIRRLVERYNVGHKADDLYCQR